MRQTTHGTGKQLLATLFSLILMFNMASLQAAPGDVGEALDDWSRSTGESILQSGERVKNRLLERSIRIRPAGPGESDLFSGEIYKPARSQVLRYRLDGEQVL